MIEAFVTLTKQFEAEYTAAMMKYLDSGDEAALHQAYEMGRKALHQGQTLLETSRFHAEVLLEILAHLPEENHRKAVVDGAAFFSERSCTNRCSKIASGNACPGRR